MSRVEGILLVGLSLKDEVQRGNFEGTLRSRWDFKRLVTELSLSKELIDVLEGLVGSVNEFRIWGCAEPERRTQRFLEWWSSAEKYVAVFVDVGNRSVICWGRIFAKIYSEELSKALWGSDKWRYVYFIKDVVWVENSLPLAELVKGLGYSEDYWPRGHQIVSPEKVQEIVRRFGSVEDFLKSLIKVKPPALLELGVSVSASAIAKALAILSNIAKGEDAATVFMMISGRVARLVSRTSDFDLAVGEALTSVLGSVPDNAKSVFQEALSMLKQGILTAGSAVIRCVDVIESGIIQSPDLMLGALVVMFSVDTLGNAIPSEVIAVAKRVTKENVYVLALCGFYSIKLLE
uniref:Uncharacterized protein n=1 Tax=Ignisphaera aggregans TaxID=334771 RepID=A0A7J2TBE4_9CREN